MLCTLVQVVEVSNVVTRHLGLPKDWLLAVPSKVHFRLCLTTTHLQPHPATLANT